MEFSTPHAVPGPTDPIYHNLLAPNQWPDPGLLPDFRPLFEAYIEQMSRVSMLFTGLMAESLELPATAFDRFFDAEQQHQLKVVKYPDSSSGGGGQGVGPHKDSMLTSYPGSTAPHRCNRQALHSALHHACHWQKRLHKPVPGAT